MSRIAPRWIIKVVEYETKDAPSIFGKDEWARPRVLVTGATGFIGRNLVKHLRSSGWRVSGISRYGGIVGDVLIDAVDCSNYDAIGKYCDGKLFDSVIHLAASIPYLLWDDVARESIISNAKMTMNLLDVFKKLNNGIFIYASSVSVYDFPDEHLVTEQSTIQPDGLYPLGKFFGELLCHQYQKNYKLPVAILRIAAPYGPDMSRVTVVKKFIQQALLGEMITLFGTGHRSQDFVYIDDIVNAIIGVCESRISGIFNVSSGSSTSMLQLATTILGALPESKSNIAFFGDDFQERYHAAFSFAKAKNAFNYEPKVFLNEGIYKCVEFLRK